MKEHHKNLLFDLGTILMDQALQAKEAYRNAMNKDEKQFQSGRLMAYYEVLSLLVTQAESFQIPIEDLHLEGLDPDRDLLGDK